MTCSECGMPQPTTGSLHLEECPKHNAATCVACVEQPVEC
jgi:hypothetical protein